MVHALCARGVSGDADKIVDDRGIEGLKMMSVLSKDEGGVV